MFELSLVCQSGADTGSKHSLMFCSGDALPPADATGRDTGGPDMCPPGGAVTEPGPVLETSTIKSLRPPNRRVLLLFAFGHYLYSLPKKQADILTITQLELIQFDFIYDGSLEKHQWPQWYATIIPSTHTYWSKASRDNPRP